MSVHHEPLTLAIAKDTEATHRKWSKIPAPETREPTGQFKKKDSNWTLEIVWIPIKNSWTCRVCLV